MQFAILQMFPFGYPCKNLGMLIATAHKKQATEQRHR